METYPTYKPKSYSKESIGKMIKVEFDGGYVQTRRTTTRIRHKWQLSYLLPPNNIQDIVNFFETNLGKDFNFVDPLTGETFVCYFPIDSLPVPKIADNLSSLDIAIEER